MMTEFIVLGGLLIVMGGVQTWLRYGPWAKEQQEVDEALAKRRAEAEEQMAAERQGAPDEERPTLSNRGSRLWTKWTAILGPLGIGLGIFLVFWGLFGE